MEARSQVETGRREGDRGEFFLNEGPINVSLGEDWPCEEATSL